VATLERTREANSARGGRPQSRSDYGARIRRSSGPGEDKPTQRVESHDSLQMNLHQTRSHLTPTTRPRQVASTRVVYESDPLMRFGVS
jgi:hypothetical protein